MKRREFLKTCAAAAPAAVCSAAAGCATVSSRPSFSRSGDFYWSEWNGLHIPCNALSKPVNVWQITDSHLILIDSRDDENRKYAKRMGFERSSKITAAEAFEKILALAVKEKPDLLLLTGDILSFPSLANVDFVKSRLDKANIPWLYTAGNHDWHFEGLPGSDEAKRSAWIEKRLLPLFNGENPLFHSRLVGGVRFVMIDNSTYNVSEEQLAFFRAEAAKGDPVVLAMHIPFWHPGGGVYTCGSPDWGSANDRIWKIEGRERWAERQSPSTFEFRKAVIESPSVVGVLAGHLHGYVLSSVSGKAFVTADSSLEGGYLKVKIG
jgi:3',5'-cyclic AMP phosphodiesterase CpdA